MQNGVGNDVRAQMTFQAQRKSTGVAYLLWLFLGGFGAHRFYLGQTGTAVAQLMLLIFGWLTVVIVIGFVLLAVLGIWLLVDAFLIPGLIEQQNMKLVDTLLVQNQTSRDNSIALETSQERGSI